MINSNSLINTITSYMYMYVFYTQKLSCSDEMIICEFRNEDVKFRGCKVSDACLRFTKELTTKWMNAY